MSPVTRGRESVRAAPAEAQTRRSAGDDTSPSCKKRKLSIQDAVAPTSTRRRPADATPNAAIASWLTAQPTPTKASAGEQKAWQTPSIAPSPSDKPQTPSIARSPSLNDQEHWTPTRADYDELQDEFDEVRTELENELARARANVADGMKALEIVIKLDREVIDRMKAEIEELTADLESGGRCLRLSVARPGS